MSGNVIEGPWPGSDQPTRANNHEDIRSLLDGLVLVNCAVAVVRKRAMEALARAAPDPPPRRGRKGKKPAP